MNESRHRRGQIPCHDDRHAHCQNAGIRINSQAGTEFSLPTRMSTKKKLPPIQPAPVQRFTVRLVDGHFVRVPKLENIAETDATRPPTVPLPDASTKNDDGTFPRRMRLVNGLFVDTTASDAKPENEPPVAIPTPLAPKPAAAPENKESADSWAFPFTTRRDPSDSSAKT